VCALSCVRARAWQDLFELPSSSTYTTLQTSKYSTHQTVDGAVAPAQAPPSDVGLAAVIAELCSGTDMYKYKTGGGGRHIRHFQIRGIGVDTALAWRNPGWLSLRKERSVLLRDVVAIHYARGDLEWHRCAPIDGMRGARACACHASCGRAHVCTHARTRARTRAAGTLGSASPAMHTASRCSTASLLHPLPPTTILVALMRLACTLCYTISINISTSCTTLLACAGPVEPAVRKRSRVHTRTVRSYTHTYAPHTLSLSVCLFRSRSCCSHPALSLSPSLPLSHWRIQWSSFCTCATRQAETTTPGDAACRPSSLPRAPTCASTQTRNANLETRLTPVLN